MSNELMQFGFEGHDVRIEVGDNGEILLVAADICDVLGIADTSQAVGRLDDDERGTCKVRTRGGVQELLAVTESGFYTLTIRSNKPQAKPFRRWVTHEVLPQIRKTGRYESAHSISPRPTREAVGIVQDYLDLARLCKAPEHLGLIEASKAIQAIGIDISALIQQSSVMEDIAQTEVMLEPTEMASVLGFKSGKAMNKMLEQIGLQSRIGGQWVATDKAEGMYYRHAWQSHGKSGYNLKWNVARVEELLSRMLGASE